MPNYDFVCEEGHRTRVFRLISQMDEPCPCETCGSDTRRGFFKEEKSLDETEYIPGTKIKIFYTNKGHQFHFRDYRCKSCEVTGEVDCTNEQNEYDHTVARCEECGSDNLEIYIGVPAIDRFSERFPYFDRGLGVMLTSKRHRREVMRQKGVVAVDGDLDIGASARKSEAIKKEDEAILADMKHRLEHHPGYKEYRQLRDRGWKPTKTVRREQ